MHRFFPIHDQKNMFQIYDVMSVTKAAKKQLLKEH